MGFEIEEFGTNTCRLQAVPANFKGFNASLFKEMLAELKEYGRISKNRLAGMAIIIACKSAIKAGDSLQPEEMNHLIDELFACQVPHFCPHGRPTMVKMRIEELDRRFGR